MGPFIGPVEAERGAQDDQFAEAPREPAEQQRTPKTEPPPEELRLPRQGGEDVHGFLGAARGGGEQSGKALVPLVWGKWGNAGV